MRRIGKAIWRWIKRGVIASAILCALIACFLTIAWFAFPFPASRLDRWPQSPRVFDRRGSPLLQVVGNDDQWRIPVKLAEMSPWLVSATIATEDSRFHSHVGVDPLAGLRALGQSVLAGRVISGASTLTMQVCRMMDDRPRTLKAKFIESFRALQLEQAHSKTEILELYLNVAPYGGNLRGAEAASLAYFGKRAADLSLAEAALIAGLPQSPARLRPDRHMERARVRQALVLRRMAECGFITADQARDASNQVLELAGALRPKPQASPLHAAWFALDRRPSGGITTIDHALQNEIDRLAREHLLTLPRGTDGAVVVIDISSGDLLAMVGSAAPGEPAGRLVNAAIARRSPGSTLKPFVYAAGFEARRINESSILYDGPIDRAGWAPINFDRTFCGQVTVAQALRRSLNVPAILAAEGIGLSRCIGLIEAAGVGLPRDAAIRAGLAVVTGAVEVSLLDLTNAYATLGRGGVRQDVRVFLDEPAATSRTMSAQSCAMIDDILDSTQRRPPGMEQRAADQVPWFMWKTGTSSGRRDAWALGHNRKVAIGVWVGRRGGSGDVQFVGGEAAQPLLGRLFDLPALRSTIAPDHATSWPVQSPLPAPIEASQALRIQSPADRSRFIAVGGSAVIHPRCNREAATQWFLNGQRLDLPREPRLELEPGGYELRCVDPAGQWASVRFDVR